MRGWTFPETGSTGPCGARACKAGDLRTRFLEEQRRLEEPADSLKPEEASGSPDEPLRKDLQISPQPPVFEPARGFPEAPAPGTPPTPAEGKPEVAVRAVPAPVPKSAGAPRIDRKEPVGHGKEGWLFRGINLLLAAFIVWLGVRFVITLYDARQQPTVDSTLLSASDSAAEAYETVERNRPLSDYRVIQDRNLFGSASNPAPDAAPEAADIKAVGLAGNEVGLSLIGTAVTKDRRQNYAVVEITKTRSQEICREKDTVANVLIKRIFRNNVIILTARGEQRLSVDEKPASGSAESLVQPAAAGMNIPEVPRIDAENKGIRFEISRNEIARTLPDLHKMLEESNSSANMPKGKPDGFSLGRLRSHDAFFRIGLRTGDVIKSVDGEAVDSPEDAELLIDRLAEGGDFSILVERRGQLQSLNLSVK